MAIDNDESFVSRFLIGLPGSFQGKFTNRHSGRESKLINIEKNDCADGGHVMILENSDRWSMTLFQEHWDGNFNG